MNIYLEALLRSVAVFLGVFFTVTWGRKSKPKWDIAPILMAVIGALILAFTQKIEMYVPPPIITNH